MLREPDGRAGEQKNMRKEERKKEKKNPFEKGEGGIAWEKISEIKGRLRKGKKKKSKGKIRKKERFRLEGRERGSKKGKRKSRGKLTFSSSNFL